MGVKKALRAMVRPVREVATAIEEQDTTCSASLPGVGPATAERIIAKLRRKVPKFALLVGRDDDSPSRRRNRRGPPRPTTSCARWATAKATPAG